MTASPESDYEWVRAPYGPVAEATVAFVRHLDPQRCLDVLAPDRRTGLLDADDAREWAADQDDVYGTALEAGPDAGEWTVVYENGGYRPVDTGMPEKLSEHGEMLAIYRGGQGIVRFKFARDGAIVRSFEPGMAWTQFGSPLPEEAGLAFDGPDRYVNLFRLAERITGHRLTSDYLQNGSGRVAVGLNPG